MNYLKTQLKGKLPQEVEATNLYNCRHSLSLSLCLPFSNRVDIPHITGLDSLHPTVPALWCHKHTQAEEYEMEKAGCCRWMVRMSERGYSTAGVIAEVLSVKSTATYDIYAIFFEIFPTVGERLTVSTT